MLTDVAGLGLALVAIRFAKRPATPERTYGFYRVEILAALANAVVLVGISFCILYEAYQRFRDPPEVQSGTMLLVAFVGLIVNILGIPEVGSLVLDQARNTGVRQFAVYPALSSWITLGEVNASNLSGAP